MEAGRESSEGMVEVAEVGSAWIDGAVWVSDSGLSESELNSKEELDEESRVLRLGRWGSLGGLGMMELGESELESKSVEIEEDGWDGVIAVLDG